MVYVNNSVGLTMHQSSVCEWDRHKMEVNKQSNGLILKLQFSVLEMHVNVMQSIRCACHALQNSGEVGPDFQMG